ncbi:MAG TPA: hypothetical protein VG939_13465 [Caulobacteraceae bacterium]|nr:hypothetical protein [Caulobacteraceae bacterium]
MKLPVCIAVALALLPGLALAGPPFLTDDPEPTDTGHWEIYAPVSSAAGRGADYDGWAGAEINYGPARNVQVTVDLPVAYAHDASGLHTGRGDLGVSVKYRFLNDEAAHVQVAVFPALTLPTASGGLGAGRVTAFLPVWAQKDAGPWSVFGGGGYAINPGPGNRNYWSGGLAVTRTVSKSLLAGLEIDRQGADTQGGRASTSLGAGAILTLHAPFRLLASGGPTFSDGGGAPGFHAYVALGLDF